MSDLAAGGRLMTAIWGCGERWRGIPVSDTKIGTERREIAKKNGAKNLQIVARSSKFSESRDYREL